jgi:uncharacterized protein involved in type VI secretion and phage assembly
VAGVSGQPSVLSFSLLEGIYGDDQLCASFIAPSGSFSSLVGKELSFSFEFGGKKEFFNGVAIGCSAEQSRISLNAKTLRHLLDKEKKQAVFCNSDVGTIVRSVLRKAGVLSIKCDLKRYYSADFKTQYNESDLFFLQRILEESNVMEFVRHFENRSELVISDCGDFTSCSLNFVKHRLETADNVNFFFGYGHSPLRPGTAFEFSGETFIVCSALHTGSQEAAFGLKDNGYRCQIAAFSEKSLRSLPHDREKPKIPGILVAKTEGFAGAYASLDSKGRYIVRMPFDGENFPMASSIPVHLAQSFAGIGCGVHFPLRGDVPVLIAFENGDIDKPIAIGAIPKGPHTGPVVGSNSFQNIIKTISGIICIFDDATRSLSVEAPKNISVKAGSELAIKTAKGAKLRMNNEKGALDMEALKKVSIKTEKGTKLCMDEEKGTLDIEAREKASVKVGKTRLGFGDSGADINMGAKENISITASKKLLLNAKQQSVLKTEKGIKISLDDSTKSLTIEAPANITIKAGGRLILKGKLVEIN